MNILIYFIFFLMGAFFGSFFTLAVYRIPKKEDILIKHSYCPNCNHKLGFFSLFPIFSYIFLHGKCRYCNNKIRPRYLILEILSGITFVLTVISLNYDYSIVTLDKIIYLVLILLYISILFIVAGIDKENIQINKQTLYVGLISEIIYMIYICTLQGTNVYQYVIYSFIFIIILLANIISKKITIKEQYWVNILILLLYMIIFCGSYLFILTVILTMIQIIIHGYINKNRKKQIPIGYYLSISNILIIILNGLIANYLV